MSTLKKQVLEVLNHPEKENLKYELKQSDILKTPEGQRKLTFEIVAFANRQGGRIIIGVKNDGELEGKNIFNIDKDKGIIDNICYAKISPIIDYNINLLELEEADLLIIDIPKRGKIPHAYIDSKNGAEIKTRIYYIRTRHGKRLVGDYQLQWLFTHQEDADFTYNCRTIITFDKVSLNVSVPIEQPLCHYNYNAVISPLSSKNFQTPSFINDMFNKSRQSFFLGITPYVLIHNLSFYFHNYWLINIQRRPPVYQKNVSVKSNYQETTFKENLKKISINDIPSLYGNVILYGNLREEVKNLAIDGIDRDGNPSFTVPLDTELLIRYEDNLFPKAKLILSHKDFKFEFIFTCSPSAVQPGISHGHPAWAIIENRLKTGAAIYEDKLYKSFQSIEIDCTFNASFTFPEEDIKLFEKYYSYAETIREILDNDWNYDQFISKLPPNKLYAIENKIDTLLNTLKDPHQ